MKTKTLLFLSLAILGGTLLGLRHWINSVADAPDAAEAVWLTDFPAAQAKASAENKPLLVDFTGSDWCPPCILLHKQVFSQTEFAEFATKKVVAVKVDFPRRKPLPPAQQMANDALAQRYGVRAFPTILVMTPAGAVKGRLGYAFGGPQSYIAKLEEIIRRF